MDAPQKFNTDSPAPMGVSTDSAILFENCPSCHTTVNVTAQEPLSSAQCPDCRSEFVVGEFIDHYQLMSVAGRGGMGVVYRAIDTSLGRELALKVLRKDRLSAQTMAQIETEAAITAAINHPHVVKVFTTGTDQGRFYIAMELVTKGTLDDLMRIQGRVPEAQVLDVAIQVAEGLRAAHQNGLVHRDVKPGNILFSDAHTAKIVDFGLAMFEQHAQETGGEIWGTPYYVSPEKLDQQPEDLRSDIYSLGATLFHALAGRPPFEAEDANMVALKHLKNQAVSLQSFAPWVSGSTAYVINRTLLKNPDQRYQTYDELIEHLEYARTQLTKQSAQPQVKNRALLESEEHQKLWSYLTFGMIGLCVVMGLGFFFFSHRHSAGVKAAPVTTSPAGNSAAYDQARQQLLAGQYDAAAQSFDAISRNPSAQTPLRQWSTVHAGLSQLLADRPDQARVYFAALAKQGFTGNDPESRQLAAFFQDLAKMASTGKELPATVVNNFSRTNYSAMGLLVAGLQDWSLGQYDNAGALLRAFESAPIANDYAWLSEYKSLAGDYVADFSDYRGALGLLKAASTMDEINKAREAMVKLKKDLRRKGGLALRIDEALVESNATAAAIVAKGPAAPKNMVAAPKSSTDAGHGSTEIKALNDLRDKLPDLCRNFHASDGVFAITHTEVTGAVARMEKVGLYRKTDWLVKFKSGLDVQINSHGPSLAWKKVDGTPIKGIEKSTADGVALKGGGVVRWADISPQSILQTAPEIIKLGSDARDAAARSWQAGIYALLTGQVAEAKRYLNEAAKANAEFADALPMVLPTKSVDLARGADATASSAVENRAEAPEFAIDARDRTKWCTNLGGPQWLQLDLRQECTIKRWVVRHAEAGGEHHDQNSVDFDLESSADGNVWTTVDKVKGNSLAVTDRTVPSFKTRYVRVKVTKPTSGLDPATRIYSLELYGPDSAEPPSLFAPLQMANSPAFTSIALGDGNAKSGSVHFNENAGEYTISAGGSDIQGKSDAGWFMGRPMQGNSKIVGHFDTVDNTNGWAKCGVMYRESDAPDAPGAFLTRSATQGITFQVRSKAGGVWTNTDERTYTGPIWLRLTRHGDTFTAWASHDGFEWAQIGTPQNVSLSPVAQVGLAATSHNSNALCTSKVTDVRITSD